VLYGGATYMDWLPGGEETLPAPLALEAGGLSEPFEGPVLATGEDDAVDDGQTADADGLSSRADAAPSAGGARGVVGGASFLPGRASNRVQGPAIDAEHLPSPGVANYLSIPAIGIETSVVTGGAVLNAAGALDWQTLPFVAVHYAPATALVGAPGNAVLAGHVVTVNMGNVFRNLYLVLPGDHVFVRTQDGGTFAYQVSQVRLVAPGAVEVMQPTPDAELTLITCGGTFNQRAGTFSNRLIVRATLLGAVTESGASS